ncbi:MAG: AAA family ATPase, partial [Polyangiaceae bacterium]|nr:AAA family ATPase [Polyangiaceae bacterium]
MAKSILITATQCGSGKTTLALGLIPLLKSSLGKIGYFKPIGRRGCNGCDPDVLLIKEALGLNSSVEEMSPVSMDQVQQALGNGTYDDILDKIIEAHQELAATCDFIICEGTDYSDSMSTFEFDINVDISKNLSAPILLAVNGADCSGSCCSCKAVKSIALAKGRFDEKGCEILGVVINQIDPDKATAIGEKASKAIEKLGTQLLGIIPTNDLLQKLLVREVVEALGTEVIAGADNLDTVVQEVAVAAMSVENMLEHLPRGALVMVPGDRDDALLGLAGAYASRSVPAPSGVVLAC